MKKITQKLHRISICFALIMGSTVLFNSCSKDFLTPDPLSVYEPAATFTNEAGLMSVLAIADRQLKQYYATDHNEMLTLGTEYIFSDLMVASATDKGSMLCDVANMLTPTSDDGTTTNDLGRTNSIWHFWQETYNGIANANTILSYVDKVEGLDETTRNAYKGRAYFHRAFRYMALVFQYGDVPLVSKLLEVPKQNYRSTKRDAILQMVTKDMEFAVQWVPDQKNMSLTGMVNKGACRMLLTKCYLALGEYAKAKEQTDILISQSGYSLMLDNFGTFNDGGEPQTWKITRNVIWDLHRAENKLIAANHEVIMGIPNRGAEAESFIKMLTMRVLYPFVFDSRIKTTDGKQALLNLRRNDANYNASYDYMRAFGRGIATFRPTYFSTNTLWRINGVMDATDLRHSSETGNWVRMEDYRVNNKASTQFGKPLTLFNPTNGALLCSDTIRRWFDVPHYKFFLDDPVNEANISGSDGNRGATNGGNADWYLYRLAEAYLLRAEAKFYINPNDPTIKDDLNALRQRAKCTQLYQGSVTIGDIMNERARELYWEEWRNVELKRVSLCLARSGRPDEWGNMYTLENFDKQSGTDAGGGSYWYQRIVHYSLYNKGPIQINATGNSNPNYTMDKKNMYWPIPYAAITANKRGQLSQNYGYDGYNPATPKWDNWEDAVADEDKTGD
ncbi:putative outer membrane starch-binding protein [Arcticibacter tournemirensis]|uniref:RagB/SusD family nutrient uptake outer membrane protein n=1 Tax=Arcticibacter tournemirensis TaxID=699437 RepID=A0A5M9H6Q6_9SPHI|nr:RagB/SusD family nutrient uptake outer membrane protein [Arcticibacter tournemirensis]KAA8481845.1 RagB/SusD family nutrient uptake outer membrane protein [Arcticibacter tournemirensis]TQM50117.1 putative outer membrane starch-binding protein [Arcticibacter tournemirensis]